MILLCGYGGDGRRVNEVEAKKQIVEICKNKRVAIIINAKPKNNIETDVEVGKFLTENKIQNKLFDLDEADISWQKYDVIYCGGGVLYGLCKPLRKTVLQILIGKVKTSLGKVLVE